ncbi:kinase-like protein [Dendrothele bispora CBS 962.96]|uniref:Kinase-like protein n=1 Tax=Dendrothele bispora (strain CBS 962.96) TaxID=1314807 RepID=A0A4S8M6Q0_DENBC|nr:kinase-like protein [Dendrothele bispora CBS 962.96]THU97972.1 kinase-like protein [Dendrothele bispora CBS 962.96]
MNPSMNRRDVKEYSTTAREFTFNSEPLGMPASGGHGYAYLDFGQVVGGQYIVKRKLGWGLTSSSWLAFDQKGNKYVALKVLNGYYSKLALQEDKVQWEVEALVSLGQHPSHCVNLLGFWREPGRGSAGEHIFLVMDLFGGDVRRLMISDQIAFPLKLAKRILLHTLRGIASAHATRIIHTDLKHDNIFFKNTMSTEQIDEWLASDPPRCHAPELSEDGLVQAAISQPLPIISIEEAMCRDFAIGDFGNALPKNTYQGLEISPPELRAPEVFIGSPWDEKVDIWSFGCLVFEVVTKQRLFHFQPSKNLQMSETECMLYQMSCYTEEFFKAEMLQFGLHSDKYFNPDCTLRNKKASNKAVPFESWLKHHVHRIPALQLSEAEIDATAKLMRRCLKLYPDERASAEELLNDPWFEGVN